MHGERVRDAFAALDAGDVSAFRELFAADALWVGVPGSGYSGETPI